MNRIYVENILYIIVIRKYILKTYIPLHKIILLFRIWEIRLLNPYAKTFLFLFCVKRNRREVSWTKISKISPDDNIYFCFLFSPFIKIHFNVRHPVSKKFFSKNAK